MNDIEAFEGNVGNPTRDKKPDRNDSDRETYIPREESIREDTSGEDSMEKRPDVEPSGSSSGEDRGDSSESGRDRKPRITVTPSDYTEIEEMAEELGTSKAGVYNRAFYHLKKQEDQVTVSPKNPDGLEAAAEALGLSKEGVYRFALQQLLSDDAIEVEM